MKLDQKTPQYATVGSAVVIGRGYTAGTSWVATNVANAHHGDIIWHVTCCSGDKVYFRIVPKGAITDLASSSVYHGVPLAAEGSAEYRVGIGFELSVVSAGSSVVSAVPNIVEVPV